MSTGKDDDDDKKKSEGFSGGTCPVNEWIRHLLYVGGMVSLHTGLAASAAVAGKPTKCPVSEWARHAVYVGGFVVLAIKAGMAAKHGPAIQNEAESKGGKTSACPVNELTRHLVYIGGMVGLVAMMNARKK